MIWRIKGLSDNFVYFNDDTFLIKKTIPEDWFINNKPVLRGKWVPAPVFRILWKGIQITVNKHLLKKTDYEPRTSFHMGQWNSASLLGFKYRYFTNSHTPHTVEKKTVESFFERNKTILEQNISYRFRHSRQFTFIALSNHLQLMAGNHHIAKPGLAYLQPYNRYKNYLNRKIKYLENNPEIKFLCVQSLEMCAKEEQEIFFNWMVKILE
jgi:hypothetical protein